MGISKARVFALTAALKAAHATVAVELTDPAGNKIKQWELEVDAGFHAIEMQLSDKPVVRHLRHLFLEFITIIL